MNAEEFFRAIPVVDKQRCNAQRPDRRQWLEVPRDQWVRYGQICNIATPYPLDEVFGGNKRMRFVVDIDSEDGNHNAIIEQWCQAVTRAQRKELSDTRKPRFHSLWFSASRPGKLSLHGVWPLVGFDALDDMRDFASYLGEAAGVQCDLGIYAGGQLRVPFSPKVGGAHPLAYVGEYDPYGALVSDPAQKWGTSQSYRPPWRADCKQPDNSKLFAYGTVVNHCADAQPDLLGSKGYEIKQEFDAFKRRLRPRNEDEHPSFEYFAARDERRACIDMRDSSTYWDPQRDMPELARLVHREPIEPYAKAVEYANKRFALLVGGKAPQLLIKGRKRDRDCTGHYITLVRADDPSRFFEQVPDIEMLNMPADSANRAFFPCNPDSKNPKPWNWMQWFVKHRLGIRRVDEVVFKPEPPLAPLIPDVLNTWQGSFTTSPARLTRAKASPATTGRRCPTRR